jgi:hypothetical protein
MNESTRAKRVVVVDAENRCGRSAAISTGSRTTSGSCPRPVTVAVVAARTPDLPGRGPVSGIWPEGSGAHELGDSGMSPECSGPGAGQ